MDSEDGTIDWVLQRMGRPVSCALCGTPTAPGALTEVRALTMRRLNMGPVIGEIGDGTGYTLIWLCPACPAP
jgi:hypothetical protein